VSHRYSGATYEQTDPAAVRIYTDAARVPSSLHEIGTDVATADESTDESRVMDDLIRKAASVGATAVVIEKVEAIEQRPPGSGRREATTADPLPVQKVYRARFYRAD